VIAARPRVAQRQRRAFFGIRGVVLFLDASCGRRQTGFMTSTFAPCQAIARATATAGGGVRALGVVASMAMRKVVATAARSPAQGPPAFR
jgi:hypothetical protein